MTLRNCLIHAYGHVKLHLGLHNSLPIKQSYTQIHISVSCATLETDNKSSRQSPNELGARIAIAISENVSTRSPHHQPNDSACGTKPNQPRSDAKQCVRSRQNQSDWFLLSISVWVSQ